ncbi:MAG: tRNA pseudouridine(55) synthase TruB [Parcubacteria group bacterium]|nr:tRNA pseudouridine(55) synthase TruB [Parcubacteria group bacterium]
MSKTEQSTLNELKSQGTEPSSEGFLLIDKPTGMTSHDVVDRIRRFTGIRKVGHAGTLDPFATGLLIVGVGRAATKEMQRLVGLDKRYEAQIVLGMKSDTDDRDGVIVAAPITTPFTKDALKPFVGEIEQVPPSYSAIKIGGKKMYEEARKGNPLKAEARQITIYSIDILSESPVLSLAIHSSSGTYIRSIAHDLGESLGGSGYVQELRRTSIGPFSIEESNPLETLKTNVEEALISVLDLLNRL